MTIHFLADLHLTARPAEKNNRTASDELRRIQSVQRPGDYLAVCGDVTDDGWEGEYAEALRLLLPWKGRVFLAPGNHDMGTLGLFVQASARRRWARLVRDLGGLTEAIVGGHLVRVYDSCILSPSPTDLARQRLGAVQRARIPGHVERAQRYGLRPLVLMHADPYCDDPTLRLVDAEKALAAIVGKADCYYGHTHHAAVRVVSGSVMRSLGAAKDGVEAVEVG